MRMMRLTVRTPAFGEWGQMSVSPYGLSARIADEDGTEAVSYVATGGQHYECKQTVAEIEQEYSEALRGAYHRYDPEGERLFSPDELADAAPA
jgi:hypothetical protein